MTSILASSIADPDLVAKLRERPQLRKATHQMLMAHQAIEACLSFLPSTAKLQETGIVLGTSQGELETTKEYYRALATQDLARPFLFQNSLHHSTTGFLSQAFGIQGPTLTIADNFFSGESALDAAVALLESGQCEYCFVVGVDVMVPDFEPGVRTLYPEGLLRGEGAACLLLAANTTAANAVHFQSLQFDRVRKAESSAFSGFYDSDAIAQVARFLADNSGNELVLSKPDGTSTTMKVKRPG